MRYRYSHIDRNNLNWMQRDNCIATLLEIRLTEGSLRGIRDLNLSFQYPISAVAGRNTSGKSTVLAITACAYHNSEDGYLPPGRNKTYYTFSDFFVQSPNEHTPSGIVLRYKFLHNNWRRLAPGPGFQKRTKRVAGRWTNYRTRVNRNVIYFGVQRVVPHYERSTHKSYRSYFANQALDDTHRHRICEIAGRIIGKTYTTFEKHSHSKYILPMVTSGAVRYSGFNMGAGETAVFEILATLFEAGRGSLLVIDEIELGLHEQAQIRLIEELKELCKELHCQIVCSTHSHVVLRTLPPEGRFFLESVGTSTIVTAQISANYASGRLRGENPGELDIFVEDGVAKSILCVGVPHRLRQRVNIKPIGSSSAVMRGLATRYLERKDNCLCVLDGDKRRTNNIARFKSYTETRVRESTEELRSWGENRLTYLPSDISPERWLINACRDLEDKSNLSRYWGVDDVQLVDDWIMSALNQTPHNELFFLSRESGFSTDQVVADLVRFLLSHRPDTFEDVVQCIVRCLEE